MHRFLPYLFLSTAMILVGSSVVAGEILLRHFPIHLGSLLRFGGASLLIVPIWLWREGRPPQLQTRTWLLLGGQALCGSVLFNIFLLHGLRSTSPAAAGIITSTTPACMSLLAWVFLKEQPSWRTSVGIILAIFGVAALNLGEIHADGHQSLVGNILVGGAVLVESLFLLIRKSIKEHLSPLAVSSLLSLLATVFFFPMGIPQARLVAFEHLPAEAWLCVLYYSGAVTVLAYLCWFAGITRVKAGTAGVFTAILPVSALVLSVLLLHQPVTPSHCLGCALALGGIVLLCNRA